MTSKTGQQARMDELVDAENKAMKAWIAVDRLSTMPRSHLASNRQSLLEMRDKIEAMLVDPARVEFELGVG